MCECGSSSPQVLLSRSPNFFSVPKIFRTQFFFHPQFFVRTQIFFGPNFFVPKYFFVPKFVFIPKFFSQNFCTKFFFRTNIHNCGDCGDVDKLNLMLLYPSSQKHRHTSTVSTLIYYFVSCKTNTSRNAREKK